MLTSAKLDATGQMALEGDNVYKLLREWDKLALKDDVLYREGRIFGEKVTQLVLPLAYRDIALTGYHDDAGYQGRDRTAYLIKSRFYWPGMDRAIEQKVEHCLRYKCRKAATGSSAELTFIQLSLWNYSAWTICPLNHQKEVTQASW